MSAVDPTKPKPFVPISTPPAPPKKESDAKGPAVDLGYVPQGPKSSYGTLFGPGVSGAVLGNASPNLASMSDEQLATKTKELVAAMKAKPGKVNDADFQTLGAMKKEIATRIAARLMPKVEPEKMGNKELVAALMAFDVAKASGMPLTKQQQAWAAKGEEVLKKRLTVDPEKALVELDDLRRAAVRDAAYKCGAALGSGVGLVDHSGFAGSLATGLVIVNALEHGDVAGAAKEFVTSRLSLLPYGRALEIISFGENALGCYEANERLDSIEKQIETQQQKLKEKAP